MSEVSAPYRCTEIEDRLLAAIEAAGLDPVGGFAPDELSTLDHFHTGGRRATLDLLELAAPDAGARVLDIGAGIGGAARLIAATWGCRVDCLELSADFCRAARLLNRLTGLDERIEVHQGSALQPPFGDASFDLVWMQNVGMNIADKRTLYAAVCRMLRPGGRFAFQELVAGPAGDPLFPVPWAGTAAESHLVGQQELGALLEEADLTPELFEDSSEAELSRPVIAAQGPLTLAVYVDDISTKSRNSRRSLEEGRTRLVKGVFRKA